MNRDVFEQLKAEGYNRIPVYRSVLADLDTPLSVYLKLADGPDAYLLESVEGGETWGRYSIIGLPCTRRYSLTGTTLTIIEDGVRLDNLIQVGHNARIGAHTAIAGLTAIAGSATVGKRCMIAGLAGVIGHVTVCDDVVITAQALITKDIHEPGVYSATFGAEKDKDWKRMVVRFRRSEALEKRVAELEAKVNKNDG